MTKILSLLLIGLVVSCSESESTEFIIDPGIKTQVEANISKSIFNFEPSGTEGPVIYDNNLYVEFYENDVLMGSTMENPNRTVFKSWYYFLQDTLCIEGAYGLFGGTGFYTEITGNNATVYHLLASDDFPTYSYSETDSLRFRIEVPCTDTKLILSEIPASDNRPDLYGYVEFSSHEFYYGTTESEKTKQRASMKIYFKSTYLAF